MTWADEVARAHKLDTSLDWPAAAAERDEEPAGEAQEADVVDGDQPDGPVELAELADDELAGRASTPGEMELERVLRDGAQRFERLVEQCQTELEDAVAARVSDLQQAIAAGTAELNRAADLRVDDLEEEVDARLAELHDAAVNDRFAELASRVAVVGRLAIVAVILSIVALGVAAAAFAAAYS